MVQWRRSTCRIARLDRENRIEMLELLLLPVWLIVYSSPLWAPGLAVGLIRGKKKNEWQAGMKWFALTNLISTPISFLAFFVWVVSQPGGGGRGFLIVPVVGLLAVVNEAINAVILFNFRKH